MTSTQPTWLVTGATGFLGANLGLSLEAHGHRIALTRSGTTPQHYDTAIAGDLVDVEAWIPRVADVRPDVIVHTAAIAAHHVCEQDPGLAQRINAEATGALAAAAEQVGSAFVYISTDAVFDGKRGHYCEEDAPSPTSVYGRTKLAGEHLAQHATDALVIRTNFFGWSPSGRRSILEFFVNELSSGHRVKGFTDFRTTSAYVQNLASTIRDLVDRDHGGVFHVTSREVLTKYEFGLAVAHEFHLDSTLITPTQADIHPPRKGDISLDVSKVEEALCRPLPTQVEGIAQAHADTAHLRGSISRSSGR